MPTFEFADKTTMEFEEFPVDKNCLRKISVRFDDDDTVEGVWAVVRPEDLKRYSSNEVTHGYALAVILQNAPLCLFPLNAWGLYVPVKLNGTQRPSLRLKDLAGDMIWCKERHEADEIEARRDKEAKTVTKAELKHARKAKKAKKKAQV